VRLSVLPFVAHRADLDLPAVVDAVTLGEKRGAELRVALNAFTLFGQHFGVGLFEVPIAGPILGNQGRKVMAR
jgi:hypothetical protein